MIASTRIVSLAVLLVAVFPNSSIAQDSRQIRVVPAEDANDAAGNTARWAIVVGIDGYADTRVPPLSGAIADAEAIADALVRYADFRSEQVFVLTSDGAEKPTASVILDQFVELSKVVQPRDMILFYFAGHGVEVDGRRYLLTYETQLGSSGSLRTSTLQVSDLMQELESLPLSDRIIMVDACRNDPIKAGQRRPNLATATMEAAFTLQATSESGVRATFLSCKRGQSAYEWGEKNRGFFSYFIEKGLSGEAAVYGKVTVTSLAGYLNENVPQAVRQQRGKEQTPFMDLKGEALTIVRAEKIAVNPEAVAHTPSTPQTRTIYGMVKDTDGQPLADMEVRLSWVAGSARSTSSDSTRPLEMRTVSDEDGFFKAEVPAKAIVEIDAGGSVNYGVNRIRVSPEDGGKKANVFLPRAHLVEEVPDTSLESSLSEAVTQETPAAIPQGIPGPTTMAEKAEELAKVANASFHVEDFDQAEIVARAALELDPKSVLARAIVANCIAVYGVNRGDHEKLKKSREMADEILRDNPGMALAHNALGIAYYADENYQKARDEFKAAREGDPDLSVAHANLGQTYYALNKYKDAEKAYRMAIKVRPDAAVPYNGLAQVLLARNKADDAVKASLEAISRYELRDIYLGSFYVNLAVALFQDGNEQAAREAVSRAKSLGISANPAYELIERGTDGGGER